MTMIVYKSPKRVAIFGVLVFCTATVMMLFIYTSLVDILAGSRLPGPQIDWRERTIELTEEESEQMGGMKRYTYGRSMPLIFIGGMPRSGTTLLRVMLDSHPDIRCGGETRVIPRLLNLRSSWLKAPLESHRLSEAGITADVLDSAVAEFMLEIIVRHGRPAKRLCNKDPFTMKTSVYISSLFPRAQFLYIIRDGRAVAHSIISRKVTITGFNISDYRQCLTKWNEATSAMWNQCQTLGPKICHPLHYEQLVLHPEETLRDVLEFLSIPWNNSVLHHEQFVNQPDGIELSKLERSTDQVVKPVTTDELAKWVGKIPEDVVRDMDKIAPMLAVLGYDPHANPPNYGDPDSLVIDKMKMLAENREEYREKEEDLIKQRDEIRRGLMTKAIEERKDAATKSP